jgi:hypothetical protein
MESAVKLDVPLRIDLEFGKKLARSTLIKKKFF